MKLVCLLGSPREGGNTDVLLSKIIEAAREKDFLAEKIVLNRLSIKPCQECGGCLKTGRCILSDDMAFVYKALDEADIVIVGSPIFFGNVSAQTKIMVDRMQCRWVRKYLLKKKGLKQNRKGAFICCGAVNSEKYFTCARKVIDIFFKVQDIEFKEELFISGVDDKGEVLKKKDALGSVSRIGERLLG